MTSSKQGKVTSQCCSPEALLCALARAGDSIAQSLNQGRPYRGEGERLWSAVCGIKSGQPAVRLGYWPLQVAAESISKGLTVAVHARRHDAVIKRLWRSKFCSVGRCLSVA